MLVLATPVAWWLAFRLDHGPDGLWWGLTAGLAAAAFGLTLRFAYKSAKLVRLSPVAAAEPRVLVRRLSFDLRGLPPTPEEVADFEKTPSPANYQELVRRWTESTDTDVNYMMTVVRDAA